MSYPHRAALVAALRSEQLTGLWSLLERLPEAEAVVAGTSMGYPRLRELMLRFTRGPAGAAATHPAPFVAALLAVAFKDRRFLEPGHAPELPARLRVTLGHVRRRRAAAPQLVLGEDITHTLPEVSACPAPLNDDDYRDVAQRHNITVAAIKAVAQVESGGRSGFDDTYRPKILFEAHHFRKYTRARYDLSHPHLSGERAAAKKYYAWDQYQRLFEALVLAPVAAIQAASWGKFQILGSNHNGWPDPVSFAQAMFVSERNHLKSFEAYCVKNGLIRHLRNKDWAQFALGYNGKNYRDFDYDTKIGRAYRQFGGT